MDFIKSLCCATKANSYESSIPQFFEKQKKKDRQVKFTLLLLVSINILDWKVKNCIYGTSVKNNIIYLVTSKGRNLQYVYSMKNP